MELLIPINRHNVNKAVLKVLSSFSDFSDYEIKVLTAMFNNNIKILDTASRKQIRTIMQTDQYTFNNYISRLRSRNALIEGKYGLVVHPNIVNAVQDKEIIIRFKIKEDEPVIAESNHQES